MVRGAAVGSDLGFSPLIHVENRRFGSLAASARHLDRFERGALEAAVAMLADVGVAVSGRLADEVGRSALAASDLDGPDPGEAAVVHLAGGKELPNPALRRGVDLEPVSEFTEVAEDSGPRFAPRPVHPGAMMIVPGREISPTEPAFLELKLFHGSPQAYTTGNKVLRSCTARPRTPSALRSLSKRRNPQTPFYLAGSHK